MEEKLQVLALELLENGLTIGTVEHCTNGLIGAAIASFDSISNAYGGTISTVSIKQLQILLDVSPNVFRTNGLVSSQVACQMALGGLYKLNNEMCISIVGHSPDVAIIPSDDDFNTVWICVATMLDKKVDFAYRKIELDGTKGENMEKCIEEALDLAICEVKKIEVNG